MTWAYLLGNFNCIACGIHTLWIDLKFPQAIPTDQDLSSIWRNISPNNLRLGNFLLFFAVVAWKDNRGPSGGGSLPVQSNCGDTSPAWRVPNSTSKCQNFAGHTDVRRIHCNTWPGTTVLAHGHHCRVPSQWV